MPQYFYELEQKTDEWLRMHLGRPTASGFDQIMTPKFEARTGQMPKSYLMEKLAEKAQNLPPPGFSSFYTEQGQMLENDAFMAFSLASERQRLTHCGFVIGDDERCGCSPDGLIGDDDGLEIKCPSPKVHMGYLLGGKLPDDYAPQVHGSLYVTGRKQWNFFSYCRKMKPFHLVVKRDEAIMAKIAECLAKFYADFDAAMQRYTAA